MTQNHALFKGVVGLNPLLYRYQRRNFRHLSKYSELHQAPVSLLDFNTAQSWKSSLRPGCGKWNGQRNVGCPPW